MIKLNTYQTIDQYKTDVILWRISVLYQKRFRLKGVISTHGGIIIPHNMVYKVHCAEKINFMLFYKCKSSITRFTVKPNQLMLLIKVVLQITVIVADKEPILSFPIWYKLSIKVKFTVLFISGWYVFQSPPVPWKSIVTSMPFWAILIAHMGQNYGYETLMTELPTFMKQVLHFNIKEVF